MTDVDDLVRETYARVLRARRCSSINSVKAFVFGSARNIAVDQFRRRQEVELLTEAIQSLPGRCRQVLTLRKICGLSLREIATELGMAEHTVEF